MKSKPDAPPEHTMLIKIPTRPAPKAPPAKPAVPMARNWQPYSFHNLEHVSKRDLSLIKNLQWVVPNVVSLGEVPVGLKKRLEELLEEPVSIEIEYVHVVSLSKLMQYVGDPTFLAVLAPHPHKSRGFLEVELGLAHHAIDTLLGGTGESVALRPLTDLEEGLMAYVVIECLKTLTPALDVGMPKLRLESVARGFAEISGLVSEEEHLCVIQLRAVFGSQVGYLRLVIPQAVLTASEPAADSPQKKARLAHAADTNGKRLRNVKCSIRAEIGVVEISGADLEQLRERDVVLIESMTYRPGEESGTAKIKVGTGLSGHFDAAVSIENKKIKLTVTGTTISSPGREAVDNGAASDNAQSLGDKEDESTTPGLQRGKQMDDQQGTELLNDIPLQISVELARLPITAEDIVTLKVGHVFDLNRTSGEPLDLSVNGRIVARGELVEVDGNLGVRIISLAG
jgi:type III secretion system YscQ/HrcQ family protein